METSYKCPRVSPLELSGKVAGSTVLLDVRSRIEFENEHIPGSINLPLGELSQRCEELRQVKDLTVICRSGKRAERAAIELAGQGFPVTVLDGGLLAWRQAGLTVKEGKKRLPIERQVQLTIGTGLLAGVALGVLVNPWFLIIPAFFGAGLTFAGLTGTCGLAVLLMKAPWNKLTLSASDTKTSLTSTACNSSSDHKSCCG